MILKKIAGIILILIGFILSVGLLFAILRSISKVIIQINKNTTYGVSYLIGTLIGVSICALITYLIINFGVKLIKSKKKLSLRDKIESIK